MKSFISIFALTWLIGTVCGQMGQLGQIVDGPCSRFQATPVQPFFKKLLMGNWYIYALYDYPLSVGLDCITFFYKSTPDGNAINIESYKNVTTNVRTSGQSILRFDRPGTGHYFYEVASASLSESITIIATDYIRYYIEYSCIDQAAGKSDCYVGVFTRKPTPDPLTLALITVALDAHHFDKSRLRYIVQDKSRCIF